MSHGSVVAYAGPTTASVSRVMDALLTAGRVVARDRVLRPGWISVRDGMIAALGQGEPPEPATHAFGDAVLVPGFVDVHCHGGGGATFGADLEATQRAVATHHAHGTTTLVASLVSAPVGSLRREVDALAELVSGGDIAGVHLEGPWLAEAYCGAHDPRALIAPTVDDVDALVRPGVVRMVTIAPELLGGLDAVRRVVAAGAVAAIGHTASDGTVVSDALRAGATHATHLFNAMPPLHHRQPGAVLALLDSDATLELIRDGHHLHPDLCQWLDSAVEPERLVAVTDAMAAAGAADGDYTLGSMAVTVAHAVARVAGTGTLAGSTATADMLFRSVAHASSADADLLRAAAQTASNPALALGFRDVGALEAGRRADVVVLDPASLEVRAVLRGGEEIR